RPAIAAALAGVPERIGLGLGRQSLFITNPGIGRSHLHDHPIDWLRALMAEMNVPLPSSEPALKVPSGILLTIGTRLNGWPGPWIVLGIGALHAEREWPQEHWVEFLAELRPHVAGTFFFIGGADYRAHAQNLIMQTNLIVAINACD